jgi:hypothetical protein
VRSAKWLWEEFRVSVSEQKLSREVRAMGYRKLAARPKHHAQAPQAIEEFKITFTPQWQKSPAGCSRKTHRDLVKARLKAIRST